MSNLAVQDKVAKFKSALSERLGSGVYSDDMKARELFSQDIWEKGTTAELVIAPKSTDELSVVAKLASECGIALNPRGAGMSYTKGYIPDREGVAMLDMTRMDRILEINTDDMYVTVEAGCSWATLYETLSENGVRTPFWGPLSGLTSTIGGGLSQNNAIFGAGKYGSTGDSILCLSVVLADGTIVQTGTSGTRGAKPFWRYYGPDLAGMFIGDAGALGFKAEITMRLIPMPQAEEWCSFDFPTGDDCGAALADLMRADIAAEIYGFDPTLTKVRMARASIMEDAKALTNVMKKQGNIFRALKEGAKVAMAGRGFMDDAGFSLHITVEGRSEAGVREEMKMVKAICAKRNGKEIENSIPKIVRANPFQPHNNILGPNGERWVPIHGIVPTSEGAACLADLEAAFEGMRDELDAHDVVTGYLMTGLGTTAFLIEPVFIWPEEIYDIHEDTVEPHVLAKMKRFARNDAATEVVKKGREKVLEVFGAHGAAHFQIGRTYPYKATRKENTLELLEKIKSLVDPDRLVNPGSLGLE